MTASNIRRAAPILIILLPMLAAGCVSEPISASGHDRDDTNTSSFSATGSRYVAPKDEWQDHPESAREPRPLTEVIHPEVPLDKLAAVTRFMTEAELVLLLGPPNRKSVETTDIDTQGHDWNATVFTWYYQDSRHTTVEMTRDFEVRLAWVGRDISLPARPEVTGPDWVVLQWELR